MKLREGGKLFRWLLAGTLLWLAAGTLAAQDVRYNYMPGTDFSKYHTYKWVSIEGGAHPNQIVDAEIKVAVDSQLVSKGLTKTDSDKLISMSAIRSPLIGRNSGTDMVWAAGSVGAGWPLPPVPPSTSGLLSSTCMTHPPNSWFGPAMPPKRSTLVPDRRKTRKI